MKETNQLHKILRKLFLFLMLFGAITSLALASTNKSRYNHRETILVTDTATFGTGCFWCTEAVFQQVKGVIKVESGYSGGHVNNPSYKDVCTGATGHAECLQIIYDPAEISFDELLEIFWEIHDPTTLNRQGNDIGTQYRSVVFYHNSRQKQIAEKYRKSLDSAGAYENKIVTTIERFQNFFAAEDYHRNYFLQNGHEPYCQYVIQPKVDKFRKVFKAKLKP